MTGPRFVITVGTDHHPFDRLIGWVNDWLAEHPDLLSSFYVQSGSARVKPACPGADFLRSAELDDVLDDADIMICHGGPGSIADAWRRGQKPIAVPRLRRFGEVVDDHQVDFCHKLDALGSIRMAEDASALHALIDEAIKDRAGFRVLAQATDGAAVPAAGPDLAVARFGELVDELLTKPRRRHQMTSRARRSRRGSAAGSGLGAVVSEEPQGQVPEAASNSQPSWQTADAGLAGIARQEQQ